MIDFLVALLATWRLSSLLVHESGPFDVFARLRDRIGVRYDERSQPVGTNEVAQALTCVWCTSVWVGLFLARGRVIRALAYSAGAILVERVVRHV